LAAGGDCAGGRRGVTAGLTVDEVGELYVAETELERWYEV
jgi:hypothetical protein